MYVRSVFQTFATYPLSCVVIWESDSFSYRFFCLMEINCYWICDPIARAALESQNVLILNFRLKIRKIRILWCNPSVCPIKNETTCLCFLWAMVNSATTRGLFVHTKLGLVVQLLNRNLLYVSGPDRGVCRCRKCQCKPKYLGDNCDKKNCTFFPPETQCKKDADSVSITSLYL